MTDQEFIQLIEGLAFLFVIAFWALLAWSMDPRSIGPDDLIHKYRASRKKLRRRKLKRLFNKILGKSND